MFGIPMDVQSSNYTSSSESTPQPITPPKLGLESFNQINIPLAKTETGSDELEINWNEELLDKELELMMAETEPLTNTTATNNHQSNSWKDHHDLQQISQTNHANKTNKTNIDNIDNIDISINSTELSFDMVADLEESLAQQPLKKKRKKRDTENEAKLVLENEDLRKSFNTLRDSYLNLCSGYNTLLERYQESEAIRCQLVLEREHTKGLLTSLNKEVVTWRRKQRENSFGKPPLIKKMGTSTVSERLLSK